MAVDVNSYAKFTVEGTPSTDGNDDRIYIATNSQTLDVTLETNPSDVLSVRYDVYDQNYADSPKASLDAPLITWNENSLASISPSGVNDTVTIDMPSSGVVSYVIRCTVVTPWGPGVFERLVCTQTSSTTPALRKTVPDEGIQARARSWSDDLNLYVEAITNIPPPSGGDQIYTFLVDPAGTPSDTVYNTIEAALTAAALVNGVVTIQFAASITTEQLSASGTYTFENTRLVGNRTDGNTTLQITGTPTITGMPPFSCHNVQLYWTGSGDLWTINDDFSMLIWFDYDKLNENEWKTAGGTRRIFHVTTSGTEFHLQAYGVDFEDDQFEVDAATEFYLYAERCTLNFEPVGLLSDYFISISGDSELEGQDILDIDDFQINTWGNTRYGIDFDTDGQEVFQGTIASVQASLGSFELNITKASDAWPGKYTVVCDRSDDAFANPIDIYGANGDNWDVNGERHYYLDKARDAAFLFSRAYSSASGFGWAALFPYGRFFNEVAYGSSTTSPYAKNQFTSGSYTGGFDDVLLKFLDGYAGIKHFRLIGSNPSLGGSANDYDWTDVYIHIESGTTVSGLGDTWGGLPRSIFGPGRFLENATIYTEALTGDNVRHEPLFDYDALIQPGGGAGVANLVFTAASAATLQHTYRCATVTGTSGGTGCFIVDAGTNVTYTVHLQGVCDVNDYAFKGAGVVDTVVHDPRSTVEVPQVGIVADGGTFNRTYPGLHLFQFGNGDIGANADTKALTPGWDTAEAEDSTTGVSRGIYLNRSGFIVGLTVQHTVGAGNGNDVDYDVLVDSGAIGTTATVASDSTTMIAVEFGTPVAVTQGDFLEVTADKAAGITDGALGVFVQVQFVAA